MKMCKKENGSESKILLRIFDLIIDALVLLIPLGAIEYIALAVGERYGLGGYIVVFMGLVFMWRTWVDDLLNNKNRED